MPLLTDRAEIRARLLADRAWSVYALGDLAPRLFEHTTWYATHAGGATNSQTTANVTPADIDPQFRSEITVRLR